MASSREALKLAFLGCGAATRMHSKTLSSIGSRVELSYASRDPEKAKRYNATHGGVGDFSSYQSAIDHPSIDAVLIATPPHQHLELTLRALAAGKHVIVEKPPFLRSADFDLVRTAEGQSGRRVLVAENYFYKPLLRRLRAYLSAGVIGELLFVQLNALKQQITADWRDDQRLAGGGALFEGGIHWINFIAHLGLEVDYISGQRPDTRDSPERSMMVTFRYREGGAGTLFYSWETPSPLKGLRISRIYGREGSIAFESNGLLIIVYGRRKRIVLPGLGDISGHRAMFEDFVKTLTSCGGELALASTAEALAKPEFTLDMAQRDLELVERVYASLST